MSKCVWFGWFQMSQTHQRIYCLIHPLRTSVHASESIRTDCESACAWLIVEFQQLHFRAVQRVEIMAQSVLALVGQLPLFVLRHLWDPFPSVQSEYLLHILVSWDSLLMRSVYCLQMNWCLYHPDPPQYLGPLTEGRMAGPAGRFPCCGQQAFRFETLPGPMVCDFHIFGNKFTLNRSPYQFQQHTGLPIPWTHHSNCKRPRSADTETGSNRSGK